MYKQCKTEQSSDRQRALEQGLLEAMTATHFSNITVSDLCARLGIPRKAFYRYFPSKEDALNALLDHAFMDMDLYISQNMAGGKNSLLRELELGLSYWKRLEPLLSALDHSGLLGLCFQRFMDATLTENLGQGGRIMPNRTLREKGVAFYHSGLLYLMLQWYRQGYPESPQQMAQLIHQLATNPLAPEG